MKIFCYTAITILLCIACVTSLFGQGCSDAGFCTMGAMRPDQPFNKKIDLKLSSVEVSFYRGTTTLSPIIYVATTDLNFSLNNKTTFQFKLPYQAITGSLGNTSGLSDLSLCFTRNIQRTRTYDLNVSLGGKIPTNNSDKTNNNGFPLPMYYQTSLGTYDLIAGASWITKHWLIATGIQYAFNANNNEFLWQRWEESEFDMRYIEEYAQANQLKRGTDVMLRIERNFRFSRFNISLGLLPIYRISKDQLINQQDRLITRDGTTGMALSGIATVGYNFDVRSGVRLLAGHKLTQREINPDGLTRNAVTTLTYFYRF